MTKNRRFPRSVRLRTALPAASQTPARWPAARSAAAIASAVFLTLAGTGAAQAVWTAAAVNPTASATSGAVTIAQTGFAELATKYSSVKLATTKPITLTNGNVPAPYALRLGTASSTPASALAEAVTVRTWPITAMEACPATPPTVATSSTWAQGVTLSGDLPAGASVRYCVQTSMSNTAAGTTGTTSLTAHMNLQAQRGNWTSPATSVTVGQSVTDTAPRKLTAIRKSHGSISLSWTAPADETVTRYQVFRDSKKIADVESISTFNDSQLAANTGYRYVIYAVDSNGNQLAASNVLDVSTNRMPPAPNAWYQVVTAAGTCVDAAAPQESGRVLATKQCSTASKFSFVADGNEYAIHASTPSMVWDSNPPKEDSVVTLSPNGDGPKAEQRFVLISLDAATATFQIRSNRENKTQCLQSSAAGATLTLQTCDAGANTRAIQKFSLVEVTP